MTLKQLSRLYFMERDIQLTQERLHQLEAEIPPGSPLIDGMPHGASLDSREEKIAIEMAQLKDDLQRMLWDSMEEKIRLMRYINTIDDPLVRQIYMLRFVDHLSWAGVADKIGGGVTEDGVKKTCYRYLYANE